MPRLAQLTTPATTSAYSAAISRLREDLGIRAILRERNITGPAAAADRHTSRRNRKEH
jgi:hypothetical protein